MRRFIAIVLMLLLPLQSAWALVAMPCMGHMNLPQAVQAAQALAPADAPRAHEAQGHGAAAHAAHAAHAGHDMGHDVAHDTPHEPGAAAHPHHAAHAGHDAAAASPPGGDGGASPFTDPCSGSAACMSLHSPPLAAAFDAGVPAPALPGWLPPAQGQRFSSVAPQRQHRPPIALAA